MNLTETDDDLCCALHSDKHNRNELISLSCGHNACVNCIISNLNNQNLICNLCNNSNQNFYYTQNKSFEFDVEQLYTALEKQLTSCLLNFKDILRTKKEKLEAQVRYVRDEIEIRIESLKIELDNIRENFNTQLNDILENFIKDQVLNDDEEDDETKFNEVISEEKLKLLRNDIKLCQFDNKENLLDYRCYFQNVEASIEKLLDAKCEISFSLSEELPNTSIVGELLINKNYKKDKLIRSKLRNIEKLKIIDLKENPFDLCLLPNNKFLASNYDHYNLTLYDENLTLLKTIDRINNKKFKPLFLASDSNTRMFIADDIGHQILMTDLDFNLINTAGSNGTGSQQFNYPRGIAYSNNYLYVCDFSNKRIQKLFLNREDDNLSFERTIQLDYMPWQIKICNNTACIRSWTLTSIIFYNLDTFKVKFKYDNHNGKISEINGYIYEYVSSNKKFYCYDQNGNLNEEIELKVIKNIPYNSFDGCLVYSKELKNIIMSMNKLGKFFQIN